MKRNVFRLLAACLFLVSIAAFAQSVSAQGKGGGGGPPPPPPPPVPFNYRLEYKQMPSGTTEFVLYDVTEVNGGIVAVGIYQIGGIYHGFIYDHQNNLFTDLTDFFGISASVSCRAISSTGIMLGKMSDASGTRRICWFDYLANPPTLNILDQQFPIIGSLTEQEAVDINVHGDIVVRIQDAATGFRFVANPFASSIVEFDMPEPLAISDSGFVVGGDPDPLGGTQYRVARWHPSMGKEVFLDVKMNYHGDVNIYGEFGAVLDDGSGARGTPCRIGNQIDWIGDTNNATWVDAVNDSSDLAYMATVDYIEKGYFYHTTQDQVYRIDNLVSDVFLNGNRQTDIYLTNRVSSLVLPTPVITGRVHNTTTNDWRIYFLFPEDPPPTRTYTSTDIPKTIPDLGKVVSSITVPVTDDFSIADLNVTLTINHGRAQDLDVFLVAPNGTRVELFTDVGGNGLNFVGTTLDDEAATAITSGATPFTGSFRPERSLGALDGLSTLGLWKLEVTDDKALKTGTIVSWSFTVETP